MEAHICSGILNNCKNRKCPHSQLHLPEESIKGSFHLPEEIRRFLKKSSITKCTNKIYCDEIGGKILCIPVPMD
jgi:hypothetical protein